MNWDEIEANWDQVGKSFRERFGQLTSRDIGTISGKKVELVRMLQEMYGNGKEEAERQVEDWRTSLRGTFKVATSTSGDPTY